MLVCRLFREDRLIPDFVLIFSLGAFSVSYVLGLGRVFVCDTLVWGGVGWFWAES